MKFIKTPTPQVAAVQLAETMTHWLDEGKQVLWLVSGGSTARIAQQTVQLLSNINLSRLTIMQGDERFGPVGHNNANWPELEGLGLTNGLSKFYAILHGKDLATTVADYETTLAQQLQKADHTIGLFGIGVDGHTAGILPYSPAATEQTKLIVGYVGPDFVRITITPPVIARLDCAIAFASGQPKQHALQNLVNEAGVVQEPAQILKQAKQCFIYNDHVGEPT